MGKNSQFRSFVRNHRLIKTTRKFVRRVSDGYILEASTVKEPDLMDKLVPEGLESNLDKLAVHKPEVAKALINKALKDKKMAAIDPDVESQEFRNAVNRHAFVKNMKQKVSFALGSVPMFKTLSEINTMVALDPTAKLALNFPLYFGVSMPAFITLHIMEHTLPMGFPRTIVKCSKIVAGMPFCLLSEAVDKTSGVALRALKLPDTPLDMQGTIGVPSEIKLEDVLQDMRKWSDDNSVELEALREIFKEQRRKGNI